MILRTLFLFIMALLPFWQVAFGQSYEIAFSQNGDTIQLEKYAVRLKKEPFVIHVTLDSLDGVLVHCSESPFFSYNALKHQIPHFQQIGDKVSVESTFNADKELFLQDNDRFNYWFYDPAHYDWHRFDTNVVVSGYQVKATKTVQQFFDLILNETRPLQAMNKPVYLTFFSISGSFKDKSARLADVRVVQLIFED